MYEVITIGSSLIDSFIRSNQFDSQPNSAGENISISIGSKVEVEQYVLRTGGGGSNTAVGFARMGFKTGVITELGKDELAALVVENLRSELVSTNLIVSEKNEHTGGSIILLGNKGGRTALVHRGAAALLDPEDIPTGSVQRADWIHISSISGRVDTLNRIFSILYKAQKSFSWNPGKKELLAIQRGEFDFSQMTCGIFIVNAEEWELVANMQEDILISVGIVIVTNGKKGGKISTDGKVFKEFSSSGTASTDDTGAGDAFSVGYVSAFLKRKTEAECLEWAKRNAESVIQHIGAKPGLLTIDQIDVHN